MPIQKPIQHPTRIAKTLLIVFLLLTWLFMCWNNILMFLNPPPDLLGPMDVVKRLSAPQGDKTAILVRSYASFMDLNFALFISDDHFADFVSKAEDAFFLTDSEFQGSGSDLLWMQRALWISSDYEPTTHYNWGEDVVWSEDGTIVAVFIDENFVFAYDLQKELGTTDSEEIQAMLESRNTQ